MLIGGRLFFFCFFDSHSKKRKLFPALARLTITSFQNALHLLEVVEVAPLLDTKLSLESHMCSCSQTRPGLSIVEHVRNVKDFTFIHIAANTQIKHFYSKVKIPQQ